MRLLLCTPFKPLDHPRLSGDVTIPRDLRDWLVARGHEVLAAPHATTKWFPWRPGAWAELLRAAGPALEAARGADGWLTYHTYYKTPDLLGPLAHARTGIPYFIFSGAYARKRRSRPSTFPGYVLNRRALLAADHIFCNKRPDVESLARLVPAERLTYTAPGIPVDRFRRDESARRRLRAEWGVGTGARVVVSAALFRPGVKVEGLRATMRACARLAERGLDPYLVLAGDGPARAELRAEVERLLPGRVRMLGLVDRWRLHEIYSAGDVFAFPGINEGLGMVYLEAQCCGLPVVATDHAGAKDVVADGEGGLLISAAGPDWEERFAEAVGRVLADDGLRAQLARGAADFVRARHDLNEVLPEMERTMREIVHAADVRGGGTRSGAGRNGEPLDGGNATGNRGSGG